MMRLRSVVSTIGIAAGLGSAALCSASCAPRSERAALSSASPLDRARAVVRAAERRDTNAVHKLVDLLEDDDDAVRMYAIVALRRLCREDFGYQYYAPPSARAKAVARWREALRGGRVTVHAAIPAGG